MERCARTSVWTGSVNLALHDAKDIIKNLLLRGIDPRGITFDTALAAYLIDPAQSGYDLPRLALACVNEMLPVLDLDDPAALSPLGGREETAALRRSISPRCARSSAR